MRVHPSVIVFGIVVNLLLSSTAHAELPPYPTPRPARTIAPLTTASSAISLQAFLTNLPAPVGVEYHEASGKLILSDNYPSGQPHNFDLIDSVGVQSQFSPIAGLTDEVYIASIRSSSCEGGFTVGEAFTGTGVAGQIARISPDGISAQIPWVTLPGESGLLRGGLFQDRYCAFGGNLIVATTAGNVWQVTSDGAASPIAFGVSNFLEGVTTVPGDSSIYGPWAGKILTGNESNGCVYALDLASVVPYCNLGIGSPENFAIIPANENFYGVDYAEKTLWTASASQFASYVGDISIISEFSGVLWDVHWDPTQGQFILTNLLQYGNNAEGYTFAPLGISGDLAIDISASPNPVYMTNKLTYLATVSNLGSTTESNVTLVDTTPAGAVLLSAKPSQGKCGGTAPIICNLGSLNGPSTAAVTITVTPKIAGTVSNLAAVSADQADPNPGNNIATTASTVLLAPELRQISSDPYTNNSSQHKTEVEPGAFAYRSTIVDAFQVGRFFDGGASDIGWATSQNGGASWTKGFLPGLTKYQKNGPYDRASDPSVAYDASHNVWLISSLGVSETPIVRGAAVVVSRSTDGGLRWGNPVTIVSGAFLDKNWTVCDNTASSPFYGHCYTEFDDPNDYYRIKMSTTSDGGLTWSPAQNTTDNASGVGGQPLVQPNGTVVVPIQQISCILGICSTSSIGVFQSNNAGATWSGMTSISAVSFHNVAGGLRAGALLPSAAIDAGGAIYVVWADCRFRSCYANDLVMSTSLDGLVWSTVSRIPISTLSSSDDHFIPGLSVDPSTSGSAAHLGLTYYYYPQAFCDFSTCQLHAGFISSANGGQTWNQPLKLGGPMSLSWIANTDHGTMVGDYIATAFAGGSAYPIIAVAHSPKNAVLQESMETVSVGLVIQTPAAGQAPSTELAVPSAAPQSSPPGRPMTAY